MKMSIGEKKILFVFGCPNREATMTLPERKSWKLWLTSWTARA